MAESFLPAFVIGYSDSSFTNPHEVALLDEPVERTGSFTHMGAQYWGFETKRHRATVVDSSGTGFRFDHKACHWLKLGLKHPARVNRITVSTKWYTGNHVPEIAISLIGDDGETQVLSRTRLSPDAEHEFTFEAQQASQCLVHCYHEGGIARINLFGEQDTQAAEPRNLLTGVPISHVSNVHYGRPSDAVAGERDLDHMFGWESARSGFGESALFHLERSAMIDEIIVDTYLHRLNPPLSCHVFGLLEPDPMRIDELMAHCPAWTIVFDDGLRVTPPDFKSYMSQAGYLKEPAKDPSQFSIRLENENNQIWLPIVSFGPLYADRWHSFTAIEHKGPVSHLLYMHYPNGGIHGLKVYGTEI